MTLTARFDDHPERRDDRRRTLRLAVPGTFTGGMGAVTVHNLSTTGLLIETATPLSEGDAFAVDLPEAGEQVAEVVWADAPMFGCRFTHPLGVAALAASQLRAEVAAPDADPADFGERLRTLRRERGLSLGDIAASLGVSKPTVWAWEHGKSRPIERRLAALADALGVTPAALEPAPSGPNAELEQGRRRIAAAYGVSPSQIRIMIEL